jgi:outer membrane protein TolC
MSPFTAVALALAVAQAHGETPSRATRAEPGPVLTLDEALTLAAERNLDLRAAQARLRQANQASWKAWSGYLPSLTASGSFTLNEAEAAIPAGVFGPDRITIVPKEQIAGQVEANQMLFSPSLWFGIQAATRGEDVTRLTVESVRRDILFGVAQAYYGVAALTRGQEVAERLLEIARRQENDARVRYQAGAIAKVGLLRAEIDRTRAEQDLLRARNSRESARIALATLLDRPVDFDVEDPPAPALPDEPGSLEEVAVAERPDVRAARRNVDAARSGKRALTGGYLPDVAAFGRWTIQNAAGFTGQEDQWAIGVGAQWRILDGGRREAEIREASARVDEAEASAASAAARARQEVRTAVLDLESARANAVKAREQRELAAENQRLVDVSFRAGAATAVEQADATAQLRNAELAYISETLGAQLAALRLLQVAGASLR